MRYNGGQHLGTVFVDGVEIRDVIECDTALGFAVVNDRDENGNFIIDGLNIKERLVTGEVVFHRDTSLVDGMNRP